VHGNDDRIRKSFRHRAAPKTRTAKRVGIDKRREVHGSLAQTGQLQSGITREPLALVITGSFAVRAFVFGNDRIAPLRIVDAHESRGLAVPHRRGVSGALHELFEGSLRKRIGTKTPHVAPPCEELVELGAKSIAEIRRHVAEFRRPGPKACRVITLITGPARAGKSTLAEQLAARSQRKVTYCATAATDETDAEWIARIAHHRERRPADWDVIETAGEDGCRLVDALRAATDDRLIVIETLGTWISDVMTNRPLSPESDVVAVQNEIEAATCELIDAIESCGADVIVVSEEVGWGIVPTHASGRLFRDVLGRANQRLRARAERAYLVVAGAAFDLKKGPSLAEL